MVESGVKEEEATILLHGGCGAIATATHGDPNRFLRLLGSTTLRVVLRGQAGTRASLLPLRPLVHPAPAPPQANLEQRWGK